MTLSDVCAVSVCSQCVLSVCAFSPHMCEVMEDKASCQTAVQHKMQKTETGYKMKSSVSQTSHVSHISHISMIAIVTCVRSLKERPAARLQYSR